MLVKKNPNLVPRWGEAHEAGVVRVEVVEEALRGVRAERVRLERGRGRREVVVLGHLLGQARSGGSVQVRGSHPSYSASQVTAQDVVAF